MLKNIVILLDGTSIEISSDRTFGSNAVAANRFWTQLLYERPDAVKRRASHAPSLPSLIYTNRYILG